MLTQVTFELQTQLDGRWKKYRQLEPTESPATAAEDVLSNGTPAVRVARMAFDPETGHTACSIVLRLYSSGRRDADPWAEIEPIRTEERCGGIEDFYSDRAREEMRTLLLRFLEDAKVTPSEVLHHDRHARRLDDAGTALQGALQKIAIAQVAGTKLSAPSRLKELMDIQGQILRRLVTEAKSAPPVKLQPGGFGDAAEGLRRAFPGSGEAEYHLGRALATHMADSRSWLEKLTLIGQLFTPDLGVADLRVLDTFAADVLSMSGCLKELVAGLDGRAEAVIAMVRFAAGEYLPPEAPPGFAAITALLAHPKAPRARWALRTRILRELYSRQPLAGGGLVEEAKQIGAIHQIVREVPYLAADQEIDESLDWRGSRITTDDHFRDALSATSLNNERIGTLLGIAANLTGQANRTLVFHKMRSLFGPDLTAELQRRHPGLATLGELCGLMRKVDAAPLLPEQKAELVMAIDGEALRLVSSEILQKRTMGPVEKVDAFLQLCPLPESRTRATISQFVLSATKRPDFFDAFIARYSDLSTQITALTKFRDMLVRAELN